LVENQQAANDFYFAIKEPAESHGKQQMFMVNNQVTKKTGGKMPTAFPYIL